MIMIVQLNSKNTDNVPSVLRGLSERVICLTMMLIDV